MNIQFKKGGLELCVLVVLCRKNFYGYELVQTISKNIDISDGTVYPLLRRLSKWVFLIIEKYIRFNIRIIKK